MSATASTDKLKVSSDPMPGIDKAVVEALKSSKLDKESVAAAVKFVKELNGGGLRAVKLFPIGIPYPEGVNVETHLSSSQLPGLLKLLQDERVRGLEIFPKGIPRPDIFVANVKFGV